MWLRPIEKQTAALRTFHVLLGREEAERMGTLAEEAKLPVEEVIRLLALAALGGLGELAVRAVLGEQFEAWLKR